MSNGEFSIYNKNQAKIPSLSRFDTGGLFNANIGNDRPIVFFNGKNIYNISNNLIYKTNGKNLGTIRPIGSTSLIAGNSLYLQNAVNIGNKYYSFGSLNDIGGATVNILAADYSSPEYWYDTGDDLPTNLQQNSIYVDSNYIYLIGGLDNGTPTADIYRSSVASPTSFTAYATLPAELYQSVLVVVGSKIYLYGGRDNLGGEASVIYSCNTSDLSTWTTEVDTIPVTLAASQGYNDGTYVYLFGGYNDGVAIATIYRAPIADPTNLSNVGSTGFAIQNAAVLNIDSNVYILGSATNQFLSSTTSDLLTWTKNKNALSTAVQHSHSLVTNDKIYLFGGMSATDGTLTNVIQSALRTSPFNFSDEIATLPTTLGGGELIKTSQYYYIIGANADTGNYYKAPINDPTNWTLAGSNGPFRRFGKAFIHENNVYYFGGENLAATKSSNGFKGTIVDGEIIDSSWQENSTQFPAALPRTLTRYNLVISGSYIYVISGLYSSINDLVYRANLSDFLTGSAAWVTVQTFTTPFFGGSTAIINNYAYIFANAVVTPVGSRSIYRASMTELANGVCNFIEQTNVLPSSTKPYYSSCVCVDDYVMLLGGNDGVAVPGDAVSNLILTTTGYTDYNLITPNVAEVNDSAVVIDPRSGALGSYSSFQRSGILPWLIQGNLK